MNQTTTRQTKFSVLMLVFCFSVFSSSYLYARIDAQLEATIRAVVQGFKDKNSAQVQRYIHPRQGYILWYRIGIPIIQTIEKRSEFAFPTADAKFPHLWFYTTPAAQQKLILTADLPKMECTTWTKSGWFYQYQPHQKVFTALIQEHEKFDLISVQQAKTQQQKVAPFENNLVEMHYVGESRDVNDSLHLFFSKLDGKWYFSAFNNSGDCDA